MTDIAEVAGDLLPTATWVGGKAPARTRAITWVRVLRARVPAFDALEAGDLVIAAPSALSVVAPGPRELQDLVAALGAVPVSGILLPEGEPRPGDDEQLTTIAAAGAEVGVPILRVPRTDAAALERTVVGYIVARGAELERQASLLESEIRRRALDGGDAAALLAIVSGFLGRALALEGSRGEPIAVHVPADAPAAAADAARYQAGAARRARTGQPSSGEAAPIALRVTLPAGDGAGPSAGAILALGAAEPSELQRAALPRVAALLALVLAREDAVRTAADRARRAEPMPSAGPPWVVAVARQRQAGSGDGPEAREAREALRRAIRLLAPARRMSLRGDADSVEIRAVLAVDRPGGADPEGRQAARAIADLVGRTVAVSRPFESPGQRADAEASARAALDAADTLPTGGPVVLAARLPVYRILGTLHQLRDAPQLASALLEPLLASRADVRREHLATLRAFLDGGVGGAATDLGIHRNTAAYRMRRIVELTGWDLSDPDLRLALGIALRFVQNG